MTNPSIQHDEANSFVGIPAKKNSGMSPKANPQGILKKS